MQHLDEEVVVGHVPVQVLVVQVLLCLQADGPDLWQAQKQLPELLRLLRVVAQGVVQQGRVHLLLDAFHQLEVLEVFDIWIEKEKKKAAHVNGVLSRLLQRRVHLWRNFAPERKRVFRAAEPH